MPRLYTLNAELATIGYLNHHPTLTNLNVHAALNVPPTHPANYFITVEQTGQNPAGTTTIEHTLAVQVWSPPHNRPALSNYALAVAAALADMPHAVDLVADCEVSHMYHFPDPDSRLERYQLLTYLTTVKTHAAPPIKPIP